MVTLSKTCLFHNDLNVNGQNVKNWFDFTLTFLTHALLYSFLTYALLIITFNASTDLSLALIYIVFSISIHFDICSIHQSPNMPAVMNKEVTTLNVNIFTHSIQLLTFTILFGPLFSGPDGCLQYFTGLTGTVARYLQLSRNDLFHLFCCFKIVTLLFSFNFPTDAKTLQTSSEACISFI